MQSFRDLDKHFGSVPAELLRQLTAVERARGRQEAFRRQHPGQLETLRQIALIQSVESSNAIENITAPSARIKQLVADKTTPQNRSEAEIAGYRRALDVVHANAEHIPFEPSYVKQLHGYLYSFTQVRDAGEFKRLDNLVEEVRPDGTKSTRFTPVSAADTPAAMEELHERFNRALDDQQHHPLLLAPSYVLDFLVIHPFRDGNGRMARLLTLLLLYQSGYEVGRFVSLEKLIDETRDSYYDALAASTAHWHEGAHDLRPWCSYSTGVLLAAYNTFEERSAALAGGRGSKQQLIEAFVRSYIADEFKIEDLRRAAPGVSDSYLSKRLSALKRAGVLEPIGGGRGSRWRILKREF